MDTVKQMAAKFFIVIRSRLFAASLLAIVSAMSIAFISANLRAITVTDGSSSRVCMTLQKGNSKGSSDAELSESVHDTVTLTNYNSKDPTVQAIEVPVTADGITALVPCTDETVQEALKKAHVDLGTYDTVNNPLDQSVTDKTCIVVTRVAYEDYTKTQSEPFPTTIKYTNTIRKGKSQIVQQGKSGERTLVYRKSIVDGKVAETKLVSSTVTIKPVNQVKLVGTTTALPLSQAPFNIELDSKGHPTHYKKVYSGRATAYSSEAKSVGNYTASGLHTKVGIVAVDPRKIPFGTKLYIVSPDGSYVYGYAIAGDTGTACRSGRALTDLYFDTYKESCQFGARTMCVYVL